MNLITSIVTLTSNVLIIDVSGGPTPEELWKLLDQCDLSNSHSSTPCISPCPSLISTGPSIKTSNVLFLNQSQNTDPTPGSGNQV